MSEREDGSPPADGLRCEVRDRVAYVTIDREDRLNAMHEALRQRIPGLMSELAADPDVWVIVFRGAGERAFSVGADLKENDDKARSGARFTPPMAGTFRNAFEAVLETPKPTIASVNGYALAGGFELVLACDLRIASDDAQFGIPEANIGMGANFASVVLPRVVPRAIALELLYLAERIPASRALEIGLVNRVVPKAELAAATEELARTIVSKAPLTIRRYKEMTTKGWELPIATALRLDVGPNPYTSKDREEGARAFVEKRAPQWKAE